MNRAASSLADRKEHQGATQNERHSQKGVGTRKSYLAKELVDYCKVIFLGGCCGPSERLPS